MSETVINKNTSIDSLTGLLDRQAGAAKVAANCEALGVENVTAIAFELVSFGKINDSIGMQLSDKVLKLLTKRLLKVYPNSLAFFRTHGDQFFLLFNKNQDLVAEMLKLFDFVQRPFAVRGEVVVLAIRAGLVKTGHDLTSSDSLIHAAELALHSAKSSVEKVVSFKPSMLQKTKRNYEIGNELRVSLVNNAKELHDGEKNSEFYLNYQPIIQVATSKVTEFEASISWQHPKRGLLSSADFEGTAEDIGAVRVLDIWSIYRACKHAVQWNLDLNKGDEIGVRVNIHMSQFLQKGLLLKILKRAVEQSKLAPNLIHLEVRELKRMPPKVYEILRDIREFGCKITLDNFGEGSTSVNELTGFHFDYIKSDRSFIDKIASDDSESAEFAFSVAKAIKELTSTLKVELICGRVQSAKEYTQLKKLGIGLVQGDYFGKPLPVLDIKQFMNKMQKK